MGSRSATLLCGILGKARMNLPERGEKCSARDIEILQLSSFRPSVPAGIFCGGNVSASLPEVETAQVGYANQQDNLEGCLQAP